MTGLKLKINLYTLIITIHKQESWSYFIIATVAKRCVKSLGWSNLEQFNLCAL